MSTELPLAESQESLTPLSDRLKRFEEKWGILNESIKDPNTPPLARVLMVETWALGTAFVGLAWRQAPWFAYLALAISFIAFALIASRARHTTTNQGSPQS